MRPSWLSLLARVLHAVALALWLGGLAVIGALVAPTVFHVLQAAPALARHPDLQKALAGAIIGGSLRLFNVLCLVCGATLLLCNLLLAWGCPAALKPAVACFILTDLLLLLIAYLAWSLFPALDAAQAQGNLPLFSHLHHLYVSLSFWQLPLLIALIGTSVVRDQSLGYSDSGMSKLA